MKNGLFTGNALKFIAMFSMLIDHIGVILLDGYAPFRIIGRLAFPIYGYLIVEGTRHTKSQLFYFLRILALGALCQAVYYFVDHSLYLNVLLTFSVSIPMIWLMGCARKNSFCTAVFLVATIFLWFALNRLSAYGITFDYGFFGIMFPVIVALSENKKEKALLAFLGLFILAQAIGGVQMWSLFAVVPLLFYNGKRGKYNLKTFFYLFYPLHLAILWGISYLIEYII